MANNSPQFKQATQSQTMADDKLAKQQQPIQKKKNSTGLPDNLNTGLGNLSGMSLGDAKVQRNTDKPTQFKLNNQNLTESSDSVTESAIQLRQAFRGSNDVNPEFASGKAAFDRMIAFIKLGVTSFTVGIGTLKVCEEAGALWEQSEAPEGMVRQYLAPVFKDKKRGWQANFWEKPELGGKETINLHLSMYQ